MKKVVFRFSVLTLLVLWLAGCGSLPTGGGLSLSELAGNKISSAMGLDDLAVEMQAMEFFALYAVYGFYGGYSYETGFTEGEGVRWSHQSEDPEGESASSKYERVFLKDLGEGRGWWRLTVTTEDESSEYEYLLTEDSDFEVVRFRDPDTGEIVEYRPEVDENEMDEQAFEKELDEEYDTESDLNEEYEDMEDYETYDEAEYSQYSLGEERITVGAGTFTAEHMVSEYRDDSDPENIVDIRSDWWISESVPGGVVRYLWENREEGGLLTSELDEILSGQTTKLESF